MRPSLALAACCAALLLRLLLLLRARSRAAAALRACGLSALFWRPRPGLWPAYSASPRNLLEAVRRRCAAAAGGRNAYGARWLVAARRRRLTRAGAGVVMGRRPVVHVGCPRLARAALAAAGSAKAPLYDAFTSFVGHALFTAEGEAWRAQRAAVTRALAAAGTQAMEAAAAREAAALLARLTPTLAAAPGGELEVDLQSALQRLTLRATFRYLAGCEVEGPGSVTGGAACERLLGDYQRASGVLRAALPAKARSASWLLLPSWLYRRATALGRAEARAAAAAHALARRALALAGEASPLACALRAGGAAPGPSGALHCAATLLFAGHDTQSATLSWAMLRLGGGEGRAWQAALRSELRSDPGQSSIGEGRVSGLEATLRETLRLHPPAPLVMRALPGSGAEGSPGGCPAGLPPCAAAAVWLYAVQREAGAWGEGAESFRPQRWLAPGGVGPEAAEAYMPFAAGARSCPGAVLASAGLRSALGVLVGGLEWSLVGEEAAALHPSTGFTVTPAKGVRLRVRLPRG